jgi:hypothetical protein
MLLLLQVVDVVLVRGHTVVAVVVAMVLQI